MKLIYALIVAAALTGCGTTAPQKEVVVQTEYIVRKAPDTMKTLPPLPTAVSDPKTASNTDAATFMNATEEYVRNLESMIKVLVDFYEKPVTDEEKTKK